MLVCTGFSANLRASEQFVAEEIGGGGGGQVLSMLLLK
jgi:hypothetical protein